MDGLTTLSQGKGLGKRLVVVVVLAGMMVGLEAESGSRGRHTAYFDIFC